MATKLSEIYLIVGGNTNENGLKERGISAVLQSLPARKRQEAGAEMSTSLMRGGLRQQFIIDDLTSDAADTHNFMPSASTKNRINK